MVMNTSKIIVSVIVILSIFIGLVYMFVFAPSLLERQAQYQEVLQIELPDGTYCFAQQLNASGRERKIYDYRIVLEGGVDALLTCVDLLELREENLDVYNGARYMRKERMTWWDPPSITQKTDYRLFQKTIGNINSKGQPFCLVQAELASNRLYIVQFGDIKTLEKKIKK